MTTMIQNQLPSGTVPLQNQVAGHTFQAGTDALGMLKDGDFVMKPLTKPVCAEREKNFYEMLETTKNPMLLSLKRLVPEYKGSTVAEINGRQIEFLKLTDLAHNMTKPCIMDIKIGKRTWDPLATKEKMLVEEEKYAACKKALGVCIPGFQVYDIETGNLHRFSKDYGKKLNATTFCDTLRLFLNAKSGLCRPLVNKFLCELKLIQKWMRNQTYFKLYSSSILFVYDAERLEAILDVNKLNYNNSNGSAVLHSENPSHLDKNSLEHEMPYNDSPEDFLKHSPSDNCANKLILNGSTDIATKTSWAHLKMIDFAHAFPSDDDSLDTNYLFGIENLVRIFEEFLKECG